MRIFARDFGPLALAAACAWPAWHVFFRLGWPAWGCYLGAVLLGWFLWAAGVERFGRFFDELERTGEKPLYAERAGRFFARLVVLYLVTAAAMATAFALVPSYLGRNPVIRGFRWQELARDKDRVGEWASLPLSQQLTVFGYAAAVLVAPLVWPLLSEILFGSVRRRYRKGAKVITEKEAMAKAKKLLRPGKSCFRFGKLLLPTPMSRMHTLLLGSTRSGKTPFLRMLMKSVLPNIAPGKDIRAVIYNAKQEDLEPVLRALGARCPIKDFSPFAANGVAWDIARDCGGSPATALEIASIFIPKEKGDKNPYFTNAARDLVAATMISFIRSGCRWDLRDLVLAVQRVWAMEQLLARDPVTHPSLQYIHQGEPARGNIVTTIQTHMAPFAFVAALWSEAKEAVSLSDFLKEDWIIILPNHEDLRNALDPLNRVLFRRLAELILAQSESKTRQTWLIIDEAREAGELEGLGRLLTKCQTKGGIVVITGQDWDGFVDAFGKERASEILGQCGLKVVLRLGSPQTAKYASDLVGKAEINKRNQTDSPQGRSETETVAQEEEVLASEFQQIPPTNEANGMTIFSQIPDVGQFWSNIPVAFLTEQLGPYAPEKAEAESTRPVEKQFIRPWDEEDFERLGLTPPAQVAAGQAEVTNQRVALVPEEEPLKQLVPEPEQQPVCLTNRKDLLASAVCAT